MTTARVGVGIFCSVFDIAANPRLLISCQRQPRPINSAEQAMQINIIVVNDMCQLDTTGAFEVLVRIPGWTVDLVAASMEPVRTDRGLTILPTQTRESAKASDILVVLAAPGLTTPCSTTAGSHMHGGRRQNLPAHAHGAIYRIALGPLRWVLE